MTYQERVNEIANKMLESMPDLIIEVFEKGYAQNRNAIVDDFVPLAKMCIEQMAMESKEMYLECISNQINNREEFDNYLLHNGLTEHK